MATTCDALSAACPALEGAISADPDNEQWKDDATWILTSSFVILTMQSGFGLLEIGCSTAGNEINVMLKNVSDILFGGLAFYLLGYGISYGQPSNAFMGLGDFLPDAVPDPVDEGVIYSRYLFQLSFAATSATIVSGCIAMRLKFEVYCGFAFYAVVVYAFGAHWVFADNGWLFVWGFHDFAGSSAVHLHGAMNGLVAILYVGARTGRFDPARAQEFAESSPTSMIFGLFMLWWGWIGFNCGSTFGITDDKWIVAARAGVNTINSSVTGGIASMVYSKFVTKGRYYRPADVVNGILGALVSSSATCAAVHTYDSLAIGVVGALLACWSNDFLFKKWWKIDDPVGALGVHGVGGIWGCLAVGLFADEDLPGVSLINSGLFRGGGLELMSRQIVGVLAVSMWSVVTMVPFFYIVGVALSGDWKDPRHGLRHDYIHIDPNLHGCHENPEEMIQDTVDKALNSRLPIMTEVRRPSPRNSPSRNSPPSSRNNPSRNGPPSRKSPFPQRPNTNSTKHNHSSTLDKNKSYLKNTSDTMSTDDDTLEDILEDEPLLTVKRVVPKPVRTPTRSNRQLRAARRVFTEI